MIVRLPCHRKTASADGGIVPADVSTGSKRSHEAYPPSSVVLTRYRALATATGSAWARERQRCDGKRHVQYDEQAGDRSQHGRHFIEHAIQHSFRQRYGLGAA